jgi:hypothetical protein
MTVAATLSPRSLKEQSCQFPADNFVFAPVGQSPQAIGLWLGLELASGVFAGVSDATGVADSDGLGHGDSDSDGDGDSDSDGDGECEGESGGVSETLRVSAGLPVAAGVTVASARTQFVQL